MDSVSVNNITNIDGQKNVLEIKFNTQKKQNFNNRRVRA